MAELKVKSNTVSAVDLFKCIFAICVVAIHGRFCTEEYIIR